jgi:hypothetical protein
VLTRIFGATRDEPAGDRIKLHRKGSLLLLFSFCVLHYLLSEGWLYVWLYLRRAITV